MALLEELLVLDLLAKEMAMAEVVKGQLLLLLPEHLTVPGFPEKEGCRSPIMIFEDFSDKLSLVMYFM